MSIPVTGSAGFIGSNFVLDWLAQGDETVIGLAKLTLRDPPGHDRGYAIESSKLERELGWKPPETLDRVFSRRSTGISKAVTGYAT